MGLFQSLRVRGPQASILWGYRTAATLSGWTVSKRRDEKSGKWLWSLSAKLGAQTDRFQLRQRPLLFTAPRRGGFWVWPVLAVTVGETTISAQLGPPEQ